MRYINPNRINPQDVPNGWDQKAQHATDEVTAATPESRSKEVNDRGDVWKEMKAALKRASHDKCWYCESIDIRSDNAVDHFRPKNSVVECPGHKGYWWLAFKRDNYRFSCTFCNSRRIDQKTDNGGGKHDHFPLRNEARRANAPADNLADEEPILLDPTVAADPGFLWFDETGQTTPHPVCCDNVNGYAHKRATASISLYHLNHTDVVEQRKVLCADIRRQVAEADRFFQKYDAGDGTAREAFQNAVHALLGRLSPEAKYSATARAMLMGLRGNHKFLELVLAAA